LNPQLGMSEVIIMKYMQTNSTFHILHTYIYTFVLETAHFLCFPEEYVSSSNSCFVRALKLTLLVSQHFWNLTGTKCLENGLLLFHDGSQAMVFSSSLEKKWHEHLQELYPAIVQR
jgi:hypothetical protein